MVHTKLTTVIKQSFVTLMSQFMGFIRYQGWADLLCLEQLQELFQGSSIKAYQVDL